MISLRTFIIPATFLFFSLSAEAAPTQLQMNKFSSVVDFFAEDDLAALIACKRPKEYNNYLASIMDAGMLYPDINQIKFRALIREKAERAEWRAKAFWPFSSHTDEKGKRLHHEQCEEAIKQVKSSMETMSEFIFSN